MSEIVTVPERKAREAARRRAAACDIMTEAKEFAAVRGGRFYVFGSVAEDRIKYDSYFDVVVDFPRPHDRIAMSDSRWSDVEADVEQALRHFGIAIEIFQAGGFDDPGVEGYKSTSAFKQGMDAG
ncbi:MAG: hypothetical protein JWP25_5441 [Bradyrhizobium sp.]|nr:hypothetical protein [Bradyrhizobium sp.]